jgi:hypothetical protein
MAIYVEQGTYAPTNRPRVFSCDSVQGYTLTSGANGTLLTGTGDVLEINSDVAGWFYVSSTANTDIAAANKNHRINAGIPRNIGAVRKGQWISFLAG